MEHVRLYQRLGSQFGHCRRRYRRCRQRFSVRHLRTQKSHHCHGAHLRRRFSHLRRGAEHRLADCRPRHSRAGRRHGQLRHSAVSLRNFAAESPRHAGFALSAGHYRRHLILIPHQPRLCAERIQLALDAALRPVPGFGHADWHQLLGRHAPMAHQQKARRRSPQNLSGH